MHDKKEYPEAFNKVVEGSRIPGFSHIYRNSNCFNQLVLSPVQGVTSLKTLFLDLFLNQHSQRPFLGKIQVDLVEEGGQKVEKRSIQNILTYKQGHDVAVKLASSLLKKKLIHQQKQVNLNLVGIYSRNRQEFYLADLACILYGITSVPLYDTLGIDNLSFCLQHSNISTCICSISNAKTLLGLKNVGNLKNIILCDQIDNQTEKALKEKFQIYDFWKLINEQQLQTAISYNGFDVDPDQCFTFSYTSGTTGVPKGAMLSHKNFLSFVAGHKISLSKLNRPQEDDVHLSILPMPHVYERIVVAHQILMGSFIVPTSGNILKLKEDIALVRPTQLIAVPRLFNRIIQGLYDTLGGEQNLKKLIASNSPILNKIREGFGGRIKFILSGSAPINPKVISILGQIFGCPFCEAYGQTQNTGGAFIQNLNDKDYGKVGVIWPSLQFKLQDIPEMGYTSDDKDSQGRPTPRGEIWLRGAGVFLGYYKSKQLTAQAITADGWLKTGDVGELTVPAQMMKLIDRKKNIFKLSQGEYVSSQKVELCYVKSKYVTEAFLHGDSLESFAVCIIAANRRQIQQLGKDLKIEKPYFYLCEDKEIITKVLNDIIQRGQEGKLNGFEQAKNLRIQPQVFAMRGIVSSTMKLQRFQAKKYYKKQIEQMYKEGPLVKNAS